MAQKHSPSRIFGGGNAMSYSICFNCKKMVSSYEKYCKDCEKIYRQDDTFWKDEKDAFTLFNMTQLRDRELSKDKLKP